jgi:dTDP-glucose 4,6-dehydratase
MSKRVLLTGIGGFIGSHVVSHLLLNTDWEIVGIDSFRHKGLTDRITTNEHYKQHPNRVRVYTHDLTAPFSPLLIDTIGPVDYIINMASDSHVDRSIDYPVPFVKNNVDLILTMLEYARQVKPQAFVQISTDEVPGPMVDEVPHKEWAVALPSNPYSASKAAQEAIAFSYWRTYQVPVVVTRTMNNVGEYQDPEKYVPKVIRAVLRGDTVTVHGNEDQIGSRYWLHARNHADAVLWILVNTLPVQFPKSNFLDMYNIVGNVRLDNLEIAHLIARILGKELKYELVDFHSTRPGHDPHYGLDGSKLQESGWVPPINFEQSMIKTVRWYEEHPEWLNL